MRHSVLQGHSKVAVSWNGPGDGDGWEDGEKGVKMDVAKQSQIDRERETWPAAQTIRFPEIWNRPSPFSHFC